MIFLRIQSKKANRKSTANGLISSDNTKTSLLDIVVSPKECQAFYALAGDFAKPFGKLMLSNCT